MSDSSDANDSDEIEAALILPLLDDMRFDKIFGSNVEFKKRVINVFLESTPKIFDKLSSALSQGHFDEISSTAHTLKGSIGNIGGKRSAELARIIEIAAKKNNMPLLLQVFTIFDREFHSFSNRLEKELLL